MDQVGRAFSFARKLMGDCGRGSQLGPGSFSLAASMRVDWKALLWVLVLSFMFWTTFFAWSYRPTKGPMKLIGL